MSKCTDLDLSRATRTEVYNKGVESIYMSCLTAISMAMIMMMGRQNTNSDGGSIPVVVALSIKS